MIGRPIAPAALNFHDRIIWTARHIREGRLFDLEITFIAIAILLLILIIFSGLVAQGATDRGRSSSAWFWTSMLFSPVLAMAFLAFLGATDEERKRRAQEDEIERVRIRRKFKAS